MSPKKVAPAAGRPSQGAFHTPFAQLASLKASLPASADTPPTTAAGPQRAVVRLERKGRRGKEVTVVEQLGLAEGELKGWLTELQKALGCGGSLEGGALLLQGDQRGRLEAFLRARGVARISFG